MSSHLANNKSVLAKLLAGENITVEHHKVHTASFDVKNRVLTLPIYKADIEPEVYDTFVAHEVGHALWTPNNEELFADRDLFAYINLIEDIRVEKMIKRKFSGLLKSFTKGYGKLLENGFFGVSESEINSLGFADRLNMKAKIGMDVIFNDEETIIANKALNVSSFNEVIEIAKEIKDYVKAKSAKNQEDPLEKEEKKGNSEAESSSGKSNSGSSGDSKGSKGSKDSEGSSTQQQPTSTPGKRTGTLNTDAPKESVAGLISNDDGNDSGSDDLATAIWAGDEGKVKTQEFADDKKSSYIDRHSAEIKYLHIPKFNLSNFIIPHDLIKSKVDEKAAGGYQTFYINDMGKFITENNTVVNNMLKNFEMKKAAEISKRALESASGALDVNKMYRYKYDENIFKKNLWTPEGKSHGFLMYIDWSGSMSEKLSETIKQTISLMSFCKKAGIAFDVYAFVDPGNFDAHEQRSIPKYSDGSILPLSTFKLIHLSSSALKNMNYKASLEMMWRLGHGCQPSIAAMGSTPLNSTIMMIPQMVEEFKMKYRVQIVNTILLTDGSASDNSITFMDHGGICTDQWSRKFFIGHKGSNYDISDSRRRTISLLDYVKNTTDTNIIGFYLEKCSRYNVEHMVKHYRKDLANDRSSFNKYISERMEEVNREKSYAIENCGYDELYVTGFTPRTEEDYFGFKDVDNEKETLKNVKKAFQKIGKDRNKKRVIMNRFIDLISKPKNIV